MDKTYQVKQYVAVVKNRYGGRFMVFRTGDDRFYLFQPVAPDGCLATFQFPVRKADLRTDLRRGLAHGWGTRVYDRPAPAPAPLPGQHRSRDHPGLVQLGDVLAAIT